ncbi:family 20 glycosylhydrolase [Actinomyces faecalis]|uniref:family 20 glycosylhydrolase n=1 Tax=Actinomyces faecalis TaxID=2722820 RepID=UPI001FD5273E|nr:family 20 glycosylhydrolase [Actinomyces faecalis]
MWRRLIAILTAAIVVGVYGVAVAEPAANTTNLALTSVVTASGQEVSGQWGPELTADGHGIPHDGNLPAVHNQPGASRWSADKQDNVWIVYDLQARAALSSVAVSWGNTFAPRYRLQVSDDAVTWSDVATDLVGKRASTVTHTLPAGTQGRYVRLETFSRSSQWSLSIWEVGIDGSYLEPEATSAADLILPRPVSVVKGSGQDLVLEEDTCLTLGDKDAGAAADLLRATLSRSYGMALADGSPGQDCQVSLNVDTSMAAEEYELAVSEEGVSIVGGSGQGVLWGAQTLLQMAGPWAHAPQRVAGRVVLPEVTVRDKPRYEWRGLLLDPARSFYEVAEVERLIDIMSSVKMNVLHLHLTEDEGWRIAVDTPADNPSGIDYSQLTAVSGATSMAAGRSKWAPSSDGRTGYYTREDYVRIVSYAASRGIAVVPEVDGPGHTLGALQAIAQLNTGNSNPKPEAGSMTAPAMRDEFYYHTTLATDSEVTYEFLGTVLKQLAADTARGTQQSALPQVGKTYLHVGGDEANSPTVTAKDYAHYMERVTGIVTGLDATPIVWNEAATTAWSSLPQGTVGQYWHGSAEGVRKLVNERGGKVIVSNAANAYFPQRPGSELGGPSWACASGACSTTAFYNWDPTKVVQVPETAVLGIEGAIWSEHLRTENDMQFLALPRLFALAEVGWTPQNQRAYTNFKARVPHRGLELMMRDATFHLASEIGGWQGSYAPTALTDVGAMEREYEIGLLAVPGLTEDELGDLALTATLTDASGASHELPVTYTMARSFHYTDENVMTGRVMNSLVHVTATLPADLPEGEGSLHVEGSVNPSGLVAGTARTAMTSVSATSPVMVRAADAGGVVDPGPEPTTPEPSPSATEGGNAGGSAAPVPGEVEPSADPGPTPEPSPSASATEGGSAGGSAAPVPGEVEPSAEPSPEPTTPATEGDNAGGSAAPVPGEVKPSAEPSPEPTSPSPSASATEGGNAGGSAAPVPGEVKPSARPTSAERAQVARGGRLARTGAPVLVGVWLGVCLVSAGAALRRQRP